VTCGAAGIKRVEVSAGDQADRVTNSTDLPSTIDGGTENDSLSGGSATDTLTGGPGADTLKGMDGADQLLARDGTADALVDCGDGGPDKADLDLVRTDPNSKVTGCETRTRSRLATGPYVALGDSLAVGFAASSPAKGYVQLLFSDYQPSLGVGQVLDVGQAGATSTALRTGGQLANALADIDAHTDTKAVTIDIGANDVFLDPTACPGHWSQPGVCPFRTNFADILGQLKAALDHDPGIESFIAMAYYNPGSLTVPVQASRAQIDRALLGSNLEVGCSDSGPKVGLNDIIYQEAGKLGIPVANPYPAFDQHGYISPTDPFHIHPNDAGYAAIAEAFQHPTAPCDG
jgi:lysophospholipase L1-like esterase